MEDMIVKLWLSFFVVSAAGFILYALWWRL